MNFLEVLGYSKEQVNELEKSDVKGCLKQFELKITQFVNDLKDKNITLDQILTIISHILKNIYDLERYIDVVSKGVLRFIEYKFPLEEIYTFFSNENIKNSEQLDELLKYYDALKKIGFVDEDIILIYQKLNFDKVRVKIFLDSVAVLVRKDPGFSPENLACGVLYFTYGVERIKFIANENCYNNLMSLGLSPAVIMYKCFSERFSPKILEILTDNENFKKLVNIGFSSDAFCKISGSVLYASLLENILLNYDLVLHFKFNFFELVISNKGKIIKDKMLLDCFRDFKMISYKNTSKLLVVDFLNDIRRRNPDRVISITKFLKCLIYEMIDAKYLKLSDLPSRFRYLKLSDLSSRFSYLKPSNPPSNSSRVRPASFNPDDLIVCDYEPPPAKKLCLMPTNSFLKRLSSS